MPPATHPRPLLVTTDDRPADAGSRYVIEAAARAELTSTIRRDLEAVGYIYPLEAVAGAAAIIRTFPTAWEAYRPDYGSQADRAAYSALLAWDSAKKEAADPAVLIARLRMQAAEQSRWAETSEREAAEFQGRVDNATARGWREDVAVWSADVVRKRASAASFRERARAFEARIAAVERLGVRGAMQAEAA